MHLDGVQRIEVVERECLDRLQGRQVVQDQGVEAEKAVEGVVGDHLWGNKQISTVDRIVTSSSSIISNTVKRARSSYNRWSRLSKNSSSSNIKTRSSNLKTTAIATTKTLAAAAT